MSELTVPTGLAWVGAAGFMVAHVINHLVFGAAMDAWTWWAALAFLVSQIALGGPIDDG